MYFMSRLWHHLHAQLFMVTCIHNIFTGSILNACIFYQLLLIVIIKFSWKLFWYIFYSTTKSCSAYSIFNEDFRELPGTLNADRLDRDIRAGQFWALLHGTLSNHPNTTDVKSHDVYLHNHKEMTLTSQRVNKYSVNENDKFSMRSYAPFCVYISVLRCIDMIEMNIFHCGLLCLCLLYRGSCLWISEFTLSVQREALGHICSDLSGIKTWQPL